MALRTNWQQVITWIVGGVILVAAWLAMEGAGDLAEDMAGTSKDDTKWSTIRPRVILAYFVIASVAVSVFFFARWLIKSAT